MSRPQDADGGVLASAVQAYRLLWRFARGRRSALSGAAMLLLGAELLRVPLPWLAGEAVNALQRSGTRGVAQAGQLLAELFGVVSLAWLCHASGRVLERNVGLHARQSLALELLNRLMRAPLEWHKREHPLETAKRAMQGTESLNEFAQSQYIYLQSIVQIVGPVTALWLITPLLGMSAAIGLALLAGVSLCFDRVLLRLNDERNAADRRNHAAWGSVLGSMLVVRAQRLYAGVRALAERRLAAVFAPLRREVLVNELKWGAVELLGTLLWIVLVVVHVLSASAQAGAGALALGTVFMVYEYARRAETCVVNFAADFGGLAHHVSGILVIEPVLQAPQTPESDTLAPSGWNRLDLIDVGLTYRKDGRPALARVRLTLERGKRYALIGPSGAGKTALLCVLAGLERRALGQIMLDGSPVGADAMRAESTLLPLGGAPLDGTLRENLAPAGGHDDSSLWAALASAGLVEAAQALPSGLDATLGDGDSRWSAGEQQRLALARGFLAARGSSLLLVDEPTSHLDPQMAARVMGNLLDLHTAACIVVALHDIALVRMFDEVIVVEAGQVVRTGAPATAVSEVHGVLGSASQAGTTNQIKGACSSPELLTPEAH